ncbi:MAG: CYTH domain-containing protein [Bacteroidales bacterium]
MATEIERKYLVCGDFTSYTTGSYIIKQGYLTGEEAPTVRIRTRDNQAFITIKGIRTGISAYEWEKEIEPEEAEELLKICRNTIIEKTRFLVPWNNLVIEVDIFSGLNSGLIMAEIEMQEEMEFSREMLPDWIGEEVSFDPRYRNSYLSRNPWSQW